MQRKSDLFGLMTALIALSFSLVAHAKISPAYIGVDAATPPEQTAVIRIAEREEHTGKPKSIFNSQQKLAATIIEIAEQGHPESLVSIRQHVFQSIREVHVRPGKYDTDLGCVSGIGTTHMNVQIEVEAGTEYLVECIGGNPKYVHAIIRPHTRIQDSSYRDSGSPIDVSGLWLMKLRSPAGAPIVLTLAQMGDRLSGKLELPERTVRVSGTVNLNSFAFQCTAIVEGAKVKLQVAGEINDNTLRGVMAYGDTQSIQIEWKAERKSDVQSQDLAK